jgi:group II intron reverse transcriptase/maturase
MTTKDKKFKKKQKLRNNEYYDIQEDFDYLYEKSKDKYEFKDLLTLILDKRNIMLAYRNIKKNKGSKTKGVNKNTIIELGETNADKLLDYVRCRLRNFKPYPVRRVEIEKEDGKKRPLGIPTIEDRLIQQCIKQVLEPICEAKFHKHSYGFRPNRSTHHAIARCMSLIHHAKLHYVVDIDIKGFFDNVNHGKMLKQIWAMGIRDKNLICIISKMIKAEIKGIGIPEKGVPQGGILSPLLSNIVLNELDWWISSQWETHKMKRVYSVEACKYDILKKSNLKKVFIVRYADDFKVFCNNRKDANKVFEAVKLWLKERLDLDISLEKSKIVNLRKEFSEFLGIKLKVHEKVDRWAVKSHMKDKAVRNCIKTIKKRLKDIQKNPTTETAYYFNSTILGLHNYYKCATNITKDFDRIAFKVRKTLYNRTYDKHRKSGTKNKAYQKYYGGYKGKVTYIAGIALFPISYVQTKPPLNFTQSINNYSKDGRMKIHDKLRAITVDILKYLMENPLRGKSSELNDNRLSLYVGQQGKCAVTSKTLKIGDMEVHHIKPQSKGGSDKYQNLLFVTVNVHKLIHATEEQTINKYFSYVNPDKSQLEKINKLRKLVGNCEICCE